MCRMTLQALSIRPYRGERVDYPGAGDELSQRLLSLIEALREGGDVLCIHGVAAQVEC